MCLWANCSYLFLGLPSRNLPPSTPPQSEFPQTTSTSTPSSSIHCRLDQQTGECPAEGPTSHPFRTLRHHIVHQLTHALECGENRFIHCRSPRPVHGFVLTLKSRRWVGGLVAPLQRYTIVGQCIETVVLYCVYLPTDLTPHTGTPGFIVVPPPIPTTTESVAKYVINAQRGWFIRWCCWVSQVGCWPADPLSSVDRNKTVKSVKIVINRAKY